MTGIVVAKCDRSVDPYQHIDRTRTEVYEHLLRLEALEREVQAIKNVNRTDWTATGIGDVVNATLKARTVKWGFRWGSKFIHWFLGICGAGVLYLIALLFKFAWKGIHVVGP